MYLVLCSINDMSAIWAYEQLKAYGLDPIELVTQEFLSVAISWEHWVDSDHSGFIVQLADGRTIDSREIKGTLNRLMCPDDKHFFRAGSDDQTYAKQEMTALFLSVLHALPKPLLNPPAAQGLSGAFRHPSEWIFRAGQSGLATIGYRLDSGDPIQAQNSWHPPMLNAMRGPASNGFVVGNRCLGNVSPGDANNFIRMAGEANTPLLGFTTVKGSSGADYFVHASPMPNLIEGGAPLIEAIGAALSQEAP